MLSEYRKITWLLPPPAHAAPRRPVAMGLHTSGTVATLWHTRRHCRKNFSATVATDITVV
jgi:hypothetical protein